MVNVSSVAAICRVLISPLGDGGVVRPIYSVYRNEPVDRNHSRQREIPEIAVLPNRGVGEQRSLAGSLLWNKRMNNGSSLELESRRSTQPNGSVVVRKGTSRRGASLRLGDILIDEGLATPTDVQRALQHQSASRVYMPLGHILVAQKALTRRQLVSVLVRYQRCSKLGELLVKAKALTAEQLAMVLAEQRRCKQALGEVVVQLKYVTEAQVRQALCLQLHINFFDLDTITLDVSLRALINPRFARKRLVVPVARVGHTLVVAMDDPTRTASDRRPQVEHGTRHRGDHLHHAPASAGRSGPCIRVVVDDPNETESSTRVRDRRRRSRVSRTS